MDHPDKPSDRSRPPIACRAASVQDRQAVIATLADAFAHEPAFSFILPDYDARCRALMRAFGIVFDEDVRAGAVFLTDQAEAVTAWRSPQQMREGRWEALRTRLPYLLAFGTAIGRAARVADLIKANLPPEGCWYLHYAGSHSQHRGQGFGGAAIRAGLALADAERANAWLETADVANLALYRSLGFEVIKSWQVPEGPRFWGMMRPAR
ncbi:MAG: GNAT family N-acetyltransferase [Porphyrobacter sp. IPPAS B-1204]|nr:MAG: GNAT family N-acetyltransferase [Porphyrobacter sp. IPPAS B-1204]